MPRMPDGDDRDETLALLLEATRLDWGSADEQERRTRLLEVVRRSLGAELAVLEGVDDRTGEHRVQSVAGEVPGDPEALAGSPLVTSVLAEGAPREVAAAEAAALLPAAVLGRGARHALALPLQTRGAVWAAGRERPAESPARRHAARVAAERLGWMQERERLYATLERAMAQILESDERMLGRIGLDIHDGPTQQLSVALLEVQLLEAELSDAEAAGATLPETLRPALARIYETLGGALHEMRELIGHLRPTQFESRRLPEILHEAIVAFESRTGSEVVAEVTGEFADEDVSLTQKITFYRILQEALNNAYRHGHARRVHVRLAQDPGGIGLEVADDGAGFLVEALPPPGPGPQTRYGIHGMRDRALLLGGSFAVDSRPGAGTTVSVFLPRWSPTSPSAPGAVAS